MGEPGAQIDKLKRVLAVTRRMAATTDLDILLGMIVDATCDVLDCERATIFLYDPARDELTSRVATGQENIRFPADRGIAGVAARTRAVVNVPDAYADPRFNRTIDQETGFRTRNLLTSPLENLSGQLVGVLQALNKLGRPFDAEDEELARTLSAQAGVALHRWRLLEEYAEKQRLARDLDIARRIQQALLPKHPPQVAGYEIAGWNRSADATGGDCYDFIPLSDGRLALLLADATGHGIGAALVIAQCRSLVRAMLSVTDELPRIAAGVNNLLAQDLTGAHFVTAFVGILDPVRHELEYVSGGQGPLLFVSSGDIESRTASDLPFGIELNNAYVTERFAFAPGALLALLTDGFFETANVGGELFAEARVRELVQPRADCPLTTLIAELHAAVQHFAAGQPQADDLTAVLVRRAR